MQNQVVDRDRIEHTDILELIPQRAPMVMIDRLISVEERSAASVFQVTEDNIFVKDGLFQESGLIENIAQTGAAMHGYHARMRGKAVKNGYIGGIKNLEIHSLPDVGKCLTTVVTEAHYVMNTSIINGEILVENQLIATCEMKVFLDD